MNKYIIWKNKKSVPESQYTKCPIALQVKEDIFVAIPINNKAVGQSVSRPNVLTPSLLKYTSHVPVIIIKG